MNGAVRVLIVATKAPWPPIDGGRVLLLRTLEGMAAAGVRPTLVAPVDPRRHELGKVAAALAPWCEPELVAARPAGAARTVLRAAAGRQPLSIARHTVPAVRRQVEELLAARRFDLVHAEQLQALPQAVGAARARDLAVVLRAQNVESALWAAAGRSGLLALEARRLAAWEGRAVGAVDATMALTPIDAAALRRLAAEAGSAQARVVEVPAPFAAELPPGAAALAGEPPVVVLGSQGWRPNEDAVAWFADEIWPEVRRALPAARLHVFGAGDAAVPVGVAAAAYHPSSGERTGGGGLAGDGATASDRGITCHGAPADSAAAFAAGSIHAVPLRFGSGVRMKVLEAWARGVPVVSTPEGAAGLEAADGVELLVARDASGFATAIRRLREEPALAAALVKGGRAALRRRHDPAEVARRMLAVYEEVVAASSGRRELLSDGQT